MNHMIRPVQEGECMKLGKKQRPKRKPRFDHIEKLYNSFTKKDMTLEAFRKAYLAEINPPKMRRELVSMVDSIQKTRTQQLVAAHQKREIDKKLAEG